MLMQRLLVSAMLTMGIVLIAQGIQEGSAWPQAFGAVLIALYDRMRHGT